MKIYPKILLSVLPMIIVTGLGAYVLTATLASRALINQSKDLLVVELNKALSITENYNQLLTQYGLGDTPANVRQAQFDATAELQQMAIGRNGYVMAIDQQGKIVYHPDSGKIGASVKQESWFQQMQAEQTGGQTFTFQQVTYLAEYNYFPDWGWYVLTVQPETEVLQPIQQALNLGILLIVLIAGLALALLAWLTKRILQPLQLVAEGAERIGQGDYAVQIPVSSHDEIGNLAAVFNQTAVQIQENMTALQESETRYEALFNQAADGIFISDLDGNYVNVNESGCQMLGYTREAILQMNVRDLATPELNPEPIRYDELRTGKIIFTERNLRHHDGHTIPVELSARMIEHDRLQATVRDITERQLAEKVLQESEEKFRVLTESSPVGVFLDDAQGNAIYINERCADLVGLPAEKALNLDWVPAIHPDDRERVTSIWANAVVNAQPFREDYRWVHADGQVVWTHGEITPVFDSDGKLSVFIGILLDITDRKQGELALRESEEKYRSLIEQLPAMVYVDQLDGQGTNLFISPQVESMLGISMAEWQARDETVWSELIHPDDRQQVVNIYHQLKQAGQSYEIEYRITNRNGQFIWVHDKGEVLKDSTGELILHGIMFDITERKQAEQKLRASEEQLKVILDTVPDYVLRIELNNKIAFINRTYPGITIDKVIGTDILEWIPPDYRHEFQAMLNQVSDNGQPAEMETIGSGVNDQPTWYLTRVRPLFDNGKVVAFIMVGQDIAERKAAEMALSETQKQLILAVRSGNVGLWDWDLLTNQVYYSPEWKNQLGHEDHEISNDFSEWESRVHPDDLERATQTINTYLEKPYPGYQNEFRMRHKDGSYRWILAQASLLYDDGKPIRMMGSHIDITKQKQAEAALRESEEKYRELFENMQEGFALEEIILDDQGKPVDFRFLEANAAYERHTGMKPKDILGHTVRELLPNASPQLIEIYGKVALTGEPQILEYYSEAYQRHYRVRTFSPQHGRFATIFEDVSERKQAEDALRQSEEKYRNIFENTQVALFRSNINTRTIIDVNQFFTELVGYSKQELIGQSTTMLWKDPDAQKTALEEIRKFGEVKNYEAEVLCKDGSVKTCLVTLKMFPEQGILEGSMVDITARKKAEQQLLQMNRLYVTLSQVNQMVVRVNNQQELYQDICNIMVEYGGFSFAAIAMLDETSGDLKPTAVTGLDLANWPFPVVNIHTGEFKDGLSSTAIRTSKIMISQDLDTDERVGNLKKTIRQLGHRSSAAVPLHLNGQCIGALSIVSTEAGMFSDEREIKLLEEMQLDISFALDKMRLAEEHRQAEEALRYEETLLRHVIDTSQAVIFVKDRDSTILLANRAMASFYNLSVEEVTGRRQADLHRDFGAKPEEVEQWLADDREVIDSGVSKYILETGTDSNNQPHWFETVKSPIDIGNDRTGLLVFSEDITARKLAEAEREELLHVIEASLNEIYIFDPDTLKFQYANQGATRNLGYSLEQLEAMTPVDLKREFTEAAFRELLVPLLQHEQEKMVFQTMHERSDGSRYPVEVNLQLVENPNRRVFLAVILDITERRQAEQALRIAEQDYRSIFENASVGIFRSTPDGRFLKVNATMARIFGYSSPDEMIRGVTDITKQLYTEAASRARFQGLVSEHGEVLNFETSNLRKDGSTFWTSTNARVARDEAGDILYYEGFISDITKIKQAEEAVRESEERFSTMFRFSPIPVALASFPEGKIRDLNEAFCELFGFTREETLGLSSDEVGMIDAAARQKVYELLKDGQAIKDVETTVRRKNGEALDLLISISFVTLGNKRYSLTSLLDITERKRAAKQVIQLTRLYATLSQVNQTIVRVTTRQELFDQICEMAVQFGEFRLAWIGLLDDESGEVIHAAQAGESVGYTETLKINIHDPQSGNLPTARALRFGTVQIIEDIESNDLMIPWRETAREYKLRSSAALPLRLRDRVIGMLHLYSAEPGFFTQPEQQLLDEMGLDISFALDKLQTEEEHNQAVEAIRQSEALYRSVFSVLNEGLLVQDTDHKILTANEAAARILGMTTDQLHGRDSYDPRWMATEEDGTPFVLENRPSTVTIQTGQPVDNRIMKVNIGDDFQTVLSINSRPISDEQGNVSGVVISFSDITERRRAAAQIQQQLKRMSALHMIDIAITSSFDLKTTLNIVLQQSMSQLQVDACAILLFNPHAQTIEYAASRGFYSGATQHTKLRVNQGYAGRVVLERQTLHITDLMDTDSKLAASLRHANEAFTDYFGIPLIVKGEVKGVLELYHRSPINPDPGWLSFLEALSTQTAIAIDNAQLFGSLQRSKHELEMAYDATIQGWSHALDLRDKETEGHTQRVTDLTLKLAQAMGVGDDELVQIRRGALLHDIGKMGVPDNILLKADTLTDREWKQMHSHPDLAHDMLSGIRYLQPALDIPYCHHEKWDGSGYPRGLKGEEIPLAARIFAVVDVWDALTSDRPYRKAWSRTRALDHIREESGRHFDPAVVTVFLSLMGEGEASAA